MKLDGELSLIDEAASCYGGPSAAYTIGLAELAQLVDQLGR
jgi:hypothetical protein